MLPRVSEVCASAATANLVSKSAFYTCGGRVNMYKNMPNNLHTENIRFSTHLYHCGFTTHVKQFFNLKQFMFHDIRGRRMTRDASGVRRYDAVWAVSHKPMPCTEFIVIASSNKPSCTSRHSRDSVHLRKRKIIAAI